MHRQDQQGRSNKENKGEIWELDFILIYLTDITFLFLPWKLFGLNVKIKVFLKQFLKREANQNDLNLGTLC